jgi:hypothetical protein
MTVGPVRISFGSGGLVIRSAAMRNQSGIFDGVAIKPIYKKPVFTGMYAHVNQETVLAVVSIGYRK